MLALSVVWHGIGEHRASRWTAGPLLLISSHLPTAARSAFPQSDFICFPEQPRQPFNLPRRKKYRSLQSRCHLQRPSGLRTAINKSYMPDLHERPLRVSRSIAVGNIHFPMPRPPLLRQPAACPNHNNASQSNSMPSACSCRVVCETALSPESASVYLALALWVSLLVTQGYASDLASLFCCCHLTRLGCMYIVGLVRSCSR
jgi:hypothetical protein